MEFIRYDGNILDFTQSSMDETVLNLADNCFVKKRKERITLYKLKLTMKCPGSFSQRGPMDFYMIINKKKEIMSCRRCHFWLLGQGKLCCENSFLLPRIFHHKKPNFDSIIPLLKANGYLELPVPDPLTMSYMDFRY